MANPKSPARKIDRTRSLQFKDSFVNHIELRASAEDVILTHGQILPHENDMEGVELLIEGRLRMPIKMVKQLRGLLDEVLSKIPATE